MPTQNEAQPKPIVTSDSLLERITRNTRWFMIIIVVLTFPYNADNTQSIGFLLGAFTIYNLLRHIHTFASLSFVKSTALVVTLDYLFIGLVSYLSGGIVSPYLIFVIFPLLLVMYSDLNSKRQPLVINLIAMTLLIVVVSITTNEITEEFMALRRGIVYVLTAAAIAYFIAKISYVVRHQRQEAYGLQQRYDIERKRLIALINSMSEGFIGLDSQHKIVLFNPSATKLLHVDNLQNAQLRDVFHIVNKAKESIDLEALIEVEPRIERNDLTLVNPDKSSINLDFTVTPVVEAGIGSVEGSITHILVVRDVTERKNLEEQREEFLSVISHELRTPIATAEAEVAILLNPKMVQLDERARHYATVAHEQVLFLSSLINDIASLSRLDKESFRTKPEPFDAKKFTEELRDEVAPRIAEKGLLFRCSIGEDLPTIITTQHEIKEIMQNLINNAIKYTREGTVIVSVESNYKSTPGILFSVQDSGIGIAQSDLPHVFEKFFRSEDYRTRESGGTGLGLYLCARLADRLKARLWVESELSHGSRFYLFLPAQSTKLPNIKDFLNS